MAKPGKKSAADMMVVALPDIKRPVPPDDLTEEQKQDWQCVVDRMPPDWFGKETHSILSEYCRHTGRARLLSMALDDFPIENLGQLEYVEHYNKLAAAADRETKAMLACARALRITQQARLDPKTAFRKYANHSDKRPPWEFKAD